MKILVLIIALSCWFFLANGRQQVLQSNDAKKGVHKQDVIPTNICKQLRDKDFCKRSVCVKKTLCYATCRCDNILSDASCNFLKKRGKCSTSRTVLLHCRRTCGYGCSADGRPCKGTALGMQSRAIPDFRITSSSNWNRYHAAIQGRLHYRRNGGRTGAWSAKYNRVGEWLQVDLGKVMKVLGVATQGRRSRRYYQWVSSYSLKYSNNGRTFTNYQGGKVFTGNKDRNSVVKHNLNPPIVARFVRVVAKTWFRHISMRMELYGCKI